MVYELDCNGSEICLRIFHLPESSRVEARAGRGSDADCIDERGETRMAALQQVARSWRARAQPDLPVVDWEAVSEALLAVRAV